MSRAVVSAAFGDHGSAMAEQSVPLIRRYASYCDADLVVLQSEAFPSSVFKGYEKLQLYRLLERYDRILYVDADVLIFPGSPDAFETFPSGSVGACDMSASRNDFSSEIRLVQRVLGDIGWRKGYFNSGVLLVSSLHREMFDPDAERLKRWMYGDFREAQFAFRDQTILNYECRRLGYPLVDLGYKFNHTPAWNCSERRFQSYFVHYAGSIGHRKRRDRIQQMRMDAFVARHDRLLQLARSYPVLNRVCDRL